MYDRNNTGKIKNHFAVKIIKALGFNADMVVLSPDVSLNEILLLLDQMMPDPEPQLLGSMLTYIGMASKDSANGRVIKPQDISDFMVKIGRPPCSLSEASLLLNSMVDYDDCSEVPELKAEYFAREVINFAKKSNALKDFR